MSTNRWAQWSTVRRGARVLDKGADACRPSRDDERNELVHPFVGIDSVRVCVEARYIRFEGDSVNTAYLASECRGLALAFCGEELGALGTSLSLGY
jgi:hypothetical protein